MLHLVVSPYNIKNIKMSDTDSFFTVKLAQLTFGLADHVSYLPLSDAAFYFHTISKINKCRKLFFGNLHSSTLKRGT